MTVINFTLNTPEPVTGKIVATPNTRHTETDNSITLPLPVTYPIENGEALLNLDPTLDSYWCWKIEVTITGKMSWTDHVLVPDTANALDYPELAHVDPATLTPMRAPAPSWYALLIAGLQSAQPGPNGGPGPQGERGNTGRTGPPNVLNIGTTTTGGADTPAAAEITGTSPEQTLNLTIPQGIQGIKGDKGDTGERGPQGTQGDKGDKGDKGDTITGPKGDKGDTGDKGNTGDRGLQGTQGVKGDKGDAGGLGVLPLLAVDLNLNNLYATGIYTNNTVTATPANNYPANLPGIVTVYPIANNVSILIQEWRPSQHGKMLAEWGRGHYTRLGNSGTWSPWRYVSSQRVDNTAGRAIYTWDDTNNREQLIYGDTGYRDIKSIITGYISGEVYYRRTNSKCTLIFQTLITNTELNTESTFNIPNSSATLQTFIPVPTANYLSQATHLFQHGWSGNHSLRKRAVESFHGQVSWETTSTWPTTLPGIAVGVIPN